MIKCTTQEQCEDDMVNLWDRAPMIMLYKILISSVMNPQKVFFDESSPASSGVCEA